MHSRRRAVRRARHAARKRLLSGLLLFVPFAVTVLVLSWLFRFLARLLGPVVRAAVAKLGQIPLFAHVPDIYVTIVVSAGSLLVAILLLYVLGFVGQIVIGRRIIALGEKIMLQIPLARNVYSASKQVVEALSFTNRAAFKSVVLVEFPRPGLKAVGFLTGRLEDRQGRKYFKVFIPTTPNPTTGFFEIVPAEEVVETDLTIEDAFKAIISGGLVPIDVFGIGSDRSAQTIAEDND